MTKVVFQVIELFADGSKSPAASTKETYQECEDLIDELLEAHPTCMYQIEKIFKHNQ